MEATHQLAERQTTADQVFDALHAQIVSLKLTPGSRISEAQVAAEFGVSRQPVREAFNRLGAAGLLLIRPQRGTQVQKFSLAEIAAARFVRLAVELELISEAARRWTGDLAADFLRVLAAQADAALLPLEVRPPSHEAGREMTQLRKLHLQLSLVTRGALREDVENQSGAVEHPALQQTLEVALLRR